MSRSSRDTRRHGAGMTTVLRHLADGLDAPTVTLGTVADHLGARAFGFVILIASLPMIIPSVPGVSTVFGLLIMAVALQIAVGRRRIRLPGRLRRYSLSSAKVRTIIAKSLPAIARVERVVRTRWLPLTRGAALNTVGGLVAVLALAMALPIPGANTPPAIACALMAIGIIERDGVVVALGVVAGLAALAVAGSILWGFFFVAGAVAG
jgi:hypothetical protein